MPQHLILPKNALKDIRSLLRLNKEQIRALGGLFALPESISPTSVGFLQIVAERLRLDRTNSESIGLVCQFLLNIVEEGHSPSEMLDDLREFISLNAPTEENDILTSLDSKRKLLESLLSQTSVRSRAMKVRYLIDLHPKVDSCKVNGEASKNQNRGTCKESPEQAELRRLSLLQEEQSAYNRACNDEDLRELVDD